MAATLRYIYPEAENLPLKEFFGIVDLGHLSYLLDELSEYYTQNLPMWWVLRQYGLNVESTDEYPVQISCLWDEHGGPDENPSARYFPMNRESGMREGSVYCYKCQITKTSLWYVHNLEKQRQEFNLLDVFEWIENEWKVNFPKKYFLDFDSDILLSMDDVSKKKNHFLFMEALQLNQSGVWRSDLMFRQRLYEILVGGLNG